MLHVMIDLGSRLGKKIANPGLQALWDGERQRRNRLNIGRKLTPPTSPGCTFEMTELNVRTFRITSERSRTDPFVAEVRYQEKLKANIQKRYRGIFMFIHFAMNDSLIL